MIVIDLGCFINYTFFLIANNITFFVPINIEKMRFFNQLFPLFEEILYKLIYSCGKIGLNCPLLAQINSCFSCISRVQWINIVYSLKF